MKKFLKGRKLHLISQLQHFSPRQKYRPQFPVQYKDFLKAASKEDACTILWDEHVDYRDDQGVHLLHVAAWTGNIELFKTFCNDTNVGEQRGEFLQSSRLEHNICFKCETTRLNKRNI